jgi:hypothetical protein
VTNWNITLLAKKKKAILQLVQQESVLTRFLQVAPNIDFNKPIRISAWETKKQGKSKQAISFKQPMPGDPMDEPEKWTTVKTYWQVPPEEREGGTWEGKPKRGSQHRGADGSIMPNAEYDEEEDTWDFKAQEKFLRKYFVENILPKVKARAKELGLDEEQHGSDADTQNFGTGKGQKSVDTDLHITDQKPANPNATSLEDGINSAQTQVIRKLLDQIGMETEATAQQLVGTSFHLLSKDAAGYIIYRVQKKIAKDKGQAVPAVSQMSQMLKDLFAQSGAVPVATTSAPRTKADVARELGMDDDDDDEVPAPKAKAAVADDDDDDDEGWTTPKSDDDPPF